MGQNCRPLPPLRFGRPPSCLLLFSPGLLGLPPSPPLLLLPFLPLPLLDVHQGRDLLELVDYPSQIRLALDPQPLVLGLRAAVVVVGGEGLGREVAEPLPVHVGIVEAVGLHGGIVRLQDLVRRVVVPLDGEQVGQGGDGLAFGLLQPFPTGVGGGVHRRRRRRWVLAHCYCYVSTTIATGCRVRRWNRAPC